MFLLHDAVARDSPSVLSNSVTSVESDAMSAGYCRDLLRRVKSTKTRRFHVTEKSDKRQEQQYPLVESGPDYRANITMFSYKRQDSCSSLPEALGDVKPPPSRESSTVEPQCRLNIRQRTDKPAGLLNRFKSRTFLRQISRSTPDLSEQTSSILSEDPTVPGGQSHLGYSRSLSRSTQVLSAGYPPGEDLFLAQPMGIHLRAGSAPEIPANVDALWKESGAGRFKVKLISEVKVQVCALNHPRNVVGKILSSKYLRRWETHHVILTDESIISQTPTGYLEKPLPYAAMTELFFISGWDSYCLRITIPFGSLLIQVNTALLRDQLYYSLVWKKRFCRFKDVVGSPLQEEDIVLKETKSLIEFIRKVPVQDASIFEAPFHALSYTFQKPLQQETVEQLFTILSPLLEKRFPPRSTFSAISRHFQAHPQSSILDGTIASVVHRVLKHNADFREAPYMRHFVLDYLLTLSRTGEGYDRFSAFLESIHGTGSTCPHPRVLPNLVSVCLEGIASCYKTRLTRWSRSSCASEASTVSVTSSGGDTSDSSTADSLEHPDEPDGEDDIQMRDCCLTVFQIISKYDDWRWKLASLLGSVPFPQVALADEAFLRKMLPVIKAIGTDPCCEVHRCIIDSRYNNNRSWFHLISPVSSSCPDDGTLWASVLETLINCCCRRKKFAESLTNYFQPIQILALRNYRAAQDTLCMMLQWDLLSRTSQESCRDSFYWLAIRALQSTETGNVLYQELLEKQMHLKELQKEGGPKTLNLPSNTTDEDLAKLFSSGSLGSLECLNLAFTRVTSACAQYLIQLPSLRSLNLWSTQFGDEGLQLVSEHLNKLEVLNLCETPVTDDGLASVFNLKQLKVLNLNSTKVSLSAFEELKEKLPGLEEVDLKYIAVW